MGGRRRGSRFVTVLGLLGLLSGDVRLSLESARASLQRGVRIPPSGLPGRIEARSPVGIRVLALGGCLDGSRPSRVRQHVLGRRRGRNEGLRRQNEEGSRGSKELHGLDCGC